MNSSQLPLRIFVAMPGTDMGPKATWRNPKEIEEHFLRPIAKALRVDLAKKGHKREVEIVIEKEKTAMGVIHQSMFREAWVADIYVADLTGANPNVYLELGVRWAMCSGPTILICQDLSEIRFNVSANRVIPYGVNPALIATAIDKIVEATFEHLDNPSANDSPVRAGAEVVSIPSKEHQELISEIARLKESRGEDLLAAARATTNNADRTRLLQQAVQVNPSFFAANFELGLLLRKEGDYSQAIAFLLKAIALKPGASEAHRELGIAYSKKGELQQAVTALESAITHNPNDFDAHSVLGGVHRRLGMAQAPQTYAWDALKQARDCYAQASKIAPDDTYPLLNVARLDLLISKHETSRKARAISTFQLVKDLCSFKANAAKRDFDANPTVQNAETAYWRMFDHADALFFSGQEPDAKKRYMEAKILVPPEFRQSVITGSVCSALEDILKSGVLDKSQFVVLEQIVLDLKAS